jgi:hypothetical protein
MKIIAAIIAVLVVVAAGAFFGTQWLGERKLTRRVDVRVVPVAYAPRDPQVLKLGKYLFESRGCGECQAPRAARARSSSLKALSCARRHHPARLGKPRATPRPTGCARCATASTRARALIMPSEDYNRMNDADFAALVAYARSLRPVAARSPSSACGAMKSLTAWAW